MTHVLVLACLLGMLGLASSTSVTRFGAPSQPSYVIVLSRQRSSSTTTSQVIASHPCALFGNEIWGEAQDILGAHGFANMTWPEVRDDTDRFLTTGRDHICRKAISDGTIPDSCDGQCTIVVKEFDIHRISVEGMNKVMQDATIEFVVLERDVEGEYCSHMEAKVNNDWGTIPGAHKKNHPHVECEDAPDDFVQTHNEWFARVRSALHRNGRSFVEVPFSLIASCRFREFAQSMYGRMGFRLPGSVPIKYPLAEAFTKCQQ
ncbi:unnamed protein product [Scytosiphon promiscuus]